MNEAPFVEHWLGPWAMRELEFNALAETVRGLDLSSHLAGPAPARARDASNDDQYTMLADGVAMIQLRGRMQKQRASLGSSASTVDTRRAIRAAVEDPEVGSILLVIDSPGGTVAGTAELAADVAAAAEKKQVVAVVEDIGASAAYWVASQASQVFAQKTAAVGSIGTYGVVVDSSQSAEKKGYKVHVVRAGDNKGVGTPGSPVTQDHLDQFQDEINALNDCFVSGVADGRGMSVDDVSKLSTGQTWIGEAAVKAGLIDGVKTIDQAAGLARESSTKFLKERKRMASASYAEIVAACPGASSEFICKELSAGATVEQAGKDFIAEMSLKAQQANAAAEQSKKDADARIAKIQADADARVAAAEAKPKPSGVDALGTAGKGDANSESGSAREEFDAAVDAKVAAGMKRPQAVSYVANKRPELQRAVVAEANANRKTGK
jgi:signal peptide peptidase SppA